jgi:hypothetical protein
MHAAEWLYDLMVWGLAAAGGFVCGWLAARRLAQRIDDAGNGTRATTVEMAVETAMEAVLRSLNTTVVRRLDALGESVDMLAVEVERIAEGQRAMKRSEREQTVREA